MWMICVRCMLTASQERSRHQARHVGYREAPESLVLCKRLLKAIHKLRIDRDAAPFGRCLQSCPERLAHPGFDLHNFGISGPRHFTVSVEPVNFPTIIVMGPQVVLDMGPIMVLYTSKQGRGEWQLTVADG